MHPKITQYLTNDNYYKMGYNYVEMEKKIKVRARNFDQYLFPLDGSGQSSPKTPRQKSTMVLL